jgi:uncharacterized YccA/Bax inhibitor family protein
MLRSSNPTLNVFQTGQVQQPASWTSLGGAVSGGVAGGAPAMAGAAPRANVMTLNGTLTASAILIGLTMTTAIASYSLISNNNALALPIGLGGMLVGLVLGLVLFFAPKAAPFLGPAYAIAEGGFVGWISLVVATKLGPGMQALPFQALTLTIAVAGGMLVGYATRIIRPGRVFRAVFTTAFIGYALFTLIAFGMAIFGNHSLSSLFSFTNGGALSIGISVLAVGLAAFSLIMVFEMINVGVQTGQPKYMEWYAGYALLVELVWLYIEILRLLSKLRR